MYFLFNYVVVCSKKYVRGMYLKKKTGKQGDFNKKKKVYS